MVIFWISDCHFSMSWHNENTDIEHELTCLWRDWKLVNSGFGAPSQ